MMANPIACRGLDACSCVRVSRVCSSLSHTAAAVHGINSNQLRHYRSSSLMARSRSTRCASDSCQSPLMIKSSELNRHFSAAGQGPSDQRRMYVKDWTQYVSKFSAAVDIGGVSRVLSSLNVDIPKHFMDFKQSVQSTIFSRKPEHKVVSEKMKDLQEFEQDNNQSVASGAIRASSKSDTKLNRVESLDQNPVSVDREQFNFEQKMYSAEESEASLNQEDKKIADDKGRVQVDVIRKPHLDLVTTKLSPLTVQALTNIPSKSEELGTVKSTLNSVYAGITRQIAGYMPSASVQRMEQSKETGSDVPAVENTTNIANSPAVKPVESKATNKQVIFQRKLVARVSIDRQTRGLVLCLRLAKTSMTQLTQLEELCQHIVMYPECTGIAVKTKVIPCLLRLSDCRNTEVAERAREALALVGYAKPVRGRGINVLCLDGGGTKGLVTISILKRLEKLSNRRIYELFDYVCGVSTGSLIAVMASVLRIPVQEIEDIYKEFSVQMFERNRLLGAGKLFMSHAYYDTGLWERILRDNIGEKTFLETARDADCPKVSAVSTLINIQRVQNFLFRNYNLPPSRQSHYAGSSSHHLWEAIRASSAAPGYYEECQIGDWIHQDGGLLTNNPTALAIHECRLLWPDTRLQCVVSIGTGKYEATPHGAGPEAAAKSSLKVKITKMVESATDTEAVHTVLLDLLPASSYFRFNPHMSEEFVLDEIRAPKWAQMKQDTEMYCRKNELQLQQAVSRLLASKPIHVKAADWLKLQTEKFI